MGTSFTTFALPGAHGAEVVDALTDWYERRGYPPVDGEYLFDGPAEDERWVIVAADERWTIVVDTDRGEHERVGWELARLAVPLLELWVLSSDVWGYRLFEGGREVESFCSNPHYLGGDAPDDDTVPRELCRVAGLAGREVEIAALFRQRKLFAEQALLRFCEAIGAPGAAADYPLWRFVQDARTEGYTVARLRFERPSQPIAVDVCSDRYPRRAPAREPPGNPGMPPLPPDTAASLAALRTLGVTLSTIFAALRFLLAPLLFVVGAIVRAAVLRGTSAIVTLPGVSVEGRAVIVAPHRMRFELPPGAALEPQMFVLGLFAFCIGELHVICTACRRGELAEQLTIAHDAVVEDDTRYFAGDRAARGLAWSEVQIDGRGKSTAIHRLTEIVDGPEALYVFWARSSVPVESEARAALRAAIAGVRFQEHSARTTE